MPRYFFHLFDGVDNIDGEGTQLAEVEDAKREAVRFAAGLLRDDPERFWSGNEWTVRVCDATHLTLFEIKFLASMAPNLAGDPVT